VPAGRNLTTTALARGLAPLGTAKPHFAEVMGFEVAQSELHDLLPTGFTAVIHDASAGIIRITPLSGNFEPGARIAYARGPASPVFEESDKAAGTHLYMPIVTCDAGGGYEGFPLRPNVEFAATSIAGVAQSPRVKTQPGLGFSIAQTGTIGAGQGSELTVEFIGALTYTNGTARLISLNASNFVLDVHRNGSVTFSVKGNNGSTVFSENAPNGTIKHGWTGLSARVLPGGARRVPEIRGLFWENHKCGYIRAHPLHDQTAGCGEFQQHGQCRHRPSVRSTGQSGPGCLRCLSRICHCLDAKPIYSAQENNRFCATGQIITMLGMSSYD